MVIINLLTLALFLLPFTFALKIIDACIKKSNALRPLGILVSLLMGGVLIVWGYVFVTEDSIISPILGWIGMPLGGVLAIFGTWRSLTKTREEVEQEEQGEKLEKEKKQQQEKWAKEEAKKILGQGEIDDYERLDTILSILDDRKSGMEASRLSYKLWDLKRKLAKRQKGKTQQ